MIPAFAITMKYSANVREHNTTTPLSTKGFAATADVAPIKTITGDSPYYRLLAEFPDLTRPPVFRRSAIRMGCNTTSARSPDLLSTPKHAASSPIDSSRHREARGHHPYTSYRKRTEGFDRVATIGH